MLQELKQKNTICLKWYVSSENTDVTRVTLYQKSQWSVNMFKKQQWKDPMYALFEKYCYC